MRRPPLWISCQILWIIRQSGDCGLWQLTRIQRIPDRERPGHHPAPAPIASLACRKRALPASGRRHAVATLTTYPLSLKVAETRLLEGSLTSFYAFLIVMAVLFAVVVWTNRRHSHLGLIVTLFIYGPFCLVAGIWFLIADGFHIELLAALVFGCAGTAGLFEEMQNPEDDA